MTVPLVLSLLTYALVVGVGGDRWLRGAPWARRRPGPALRLWVGLALSCITAGIAALLSFAHDVLERFLMWAVHAGKSELHSAYAGPGATDPTWNMAAVAAASLSTVALACLALEMIYTAQVRRRLRRPLGNARDRLVAGQTVLVVTASSPVAFCVPGRNRVDRPGFLSRCHPRSWLRGRGTIVVSEALETVLSEDELAAAVEHEVGHLRRGHHRWILAADTLGRLLSRVGLMTSLRSQVRLLAELEADDRATARTGAHVLARALLATAEASLRPAPVALSLGEAAVGARVERLLSAVRREGEAATEGEIPARPDRVADLGLGLVFSWLALPALAAGPVLAVLLPGLLLQGSAH